MKKSILLIGYKDHFIFNVIKSGLERENFSVVTQLLSKKEAIDNTLPGLWLLILDKDLLSNADILGKINEKAVSSNARIFLAGSDEDLTIASGIISKNVIAATFKKPLNIMELGDTLNHSIFGNSDEDTVRILVIDDDSTMLHFVEQLISSSYTVYLANSGESALSFLKNNRVDLILLDIRMPNMDGFETIVHIRKLKNFETTPIVFFTANDDLEAEAKCLSAGGADFIRKPFLPEVLQLRVRNIIELEKLRKRLSSEVDKKTQQVTKQKRQIEELIVEIVQTLSGAIDAKDRYTNGHSLRVAHYSMEIARRYGYSIEEQKSVFIAGLLHDVGKIGISDAILNKPDKLTDEEYAIIMTHPTIGAEILKNVKSFPDFAIGAHWHHERYDGNGYPDGLKGEDIPEIARIIGVADAYDTMASTRSYRTYLPQDRIKKEISEGRGKQFSPEFADIMLQMIEEDTEYDMHEK